ncbi:GNAT family N-acetyltransferase [Clostridium sp. D2Q-11]|uniref:GNAT family N-acetyltransferase n=1 Tax=Anaeromonas frigoriresistens TaxID=2683708 RepID=A0A942Z5Y6_9FIRM|nr:GNAT family N-acetyltransferase [Anaeromonas frigoriresistens]
MDFQEQGYGKTSLLKLINFIKYDHNGKQLYTSVKPQNKIAKTLYESVGFRKTGEIKWNEEILVVDI